MENKRERRKTQIKRERGVYPKVMALQKEEGEGDRGERLKIETARAGEKSHTTKNET